MIGMEKIILLAVAIYIIIKVAIAYFRVRGILAKFNAMSKRLSHILREEKDPQLFVEEIEKYKKDEAFKRLKDYLNISKMQGLMYLGNYGEMKNTASEIDYAKLDEIHKIYYYTYLTACLFYTGNVDEAQKVLSENKGLFEQVDRILFKNDQAKVKEYIKATHRIIYAVDGFHSGDVSESERELAELVREDINDYEKAIAYYYLGLISGKKDDLQRKEEYFRKATELGKNLFFIEKIGRLS